MDRLPRLRLETALSIAPTLANGDELSAAIENAQVATLRDVKLTGGPTARAR
jgi:hypothetical protein